MLSIRPTASSAMKQEDWASMTDSGLLALSRSGDRHAFDALVIRHSGAAYCTALAIVRSHIDAEDVVQDALVHAYTRLNGFRGDSTFKTWLIAIVRNQAISRLRSRRRRVRRDAVSPDGPDVVGTLASREPSPEDVVLDRERRRHVARCIDELPSKLRDALRLAHNGEHSYEEMGTMLGAPTGTIKSRVSVARRIVMRRLQSSSSPFALSENVS
jgi:RNA polymerase sigma-70 factor (ECF subfamily)